MKTKSRQKGIGSLFQKFYLILIFILSVSVVYGQEQITVSGTVTDAETDEPLPGVNIVVQGTTTGTTTDMDGNYTIEAPADATLVFSFVGYQEQTVEIEGRQNIDVAMQQSITELEEVVAIGYGTQKKANVTGAVATVESDNLEKVQTVNSTSLLEGQLSGVITKQTSGQPGMSDVNISIRGFDNPLILVDGVERDLSTIDPSMIESISVLKDASAAIYGARSGNGVILVNTKQGEQGQDFKFNYNGTYSVQQFTNKPEIVTNSGKYLELWREAEMNVGLTPTYTEEEVQNYYEGGEGYPSFDWWDYTFKDWAPRQKHNLSVQGGGEDIAYYAGIGLNEQDGMIESNDWWFNRYNIRSNVEAEITDNFTSTLNLNYIHGHRSRARPQTWRDIYKTQPMAAPFPDIPLSNEMVPASNTYGTHQRLIGEMHKDIEGGWDHLTNEFHSKFQLSYDFPFVEGLTTDFNFDYQLTNFRNKQTIEQFTVYKRGPGGDLIRDGRFPAHVINSYLNYTDHKFTRLKPSLEIRYNREFGEHSIDGLLVGEYIEEGTNEIVAETEDLLTTELEYLSMGNRTYHEMDQFVNEYSRASFAGRLQYSFQNKYLLEGTFRYDASSSFPPDGRWGFFPSVSAGWRISEEPFMQISELENLKLRFSYSETGYDQNAIPYDYFAGYNVYTNPPYIFGNTAFRRIERGSLPNNSMTWEKMTNYNVGIDFTLWDGKLTTVLEGFYRHRGDILTYPQRAFPSTFGASLPQRNLNSTTDRGFETEVIHKNQMGDFNYSVRGNVTLARAKWEHFEEEEYETEAEKRIFKNTGKWQNRSIGYVSDGLFRSEEEIANEPVDQDQQGNSTLRPGDIRYKDLNDDGVINWKDQKRIGYGTGDPDLTYGLDLSVGYKGLNLSVLFKGGSMYAGNVSGLAQSAFQNQSTPLEVHWEERFHPEKNPDGKLPLVTMGERQHNLKYSDFWLININYLRVENINLSYTIPKSFITPMGIEKVSAYISANNVAVMDNLGIWAASFDPEAPLSHFGYPPHRTVTLGLNVQF